MKYTLAFLLLFSPTVSWKENPSKIIEGSTLLASVPMSKFEKHSPMWLRVDVDYTNPDTISQRIFILPMSIQDTSFVSTFIVPKNASRIMLAYCNAEHTEIDSTHIRVLDENNKPKRRSSLPYLIINNTNFEELKEELEQYPDSYDVYPYLWIFYKATKNDKEYLYRVKEDLDYLKLQPRTPELYGAIIKGSVILNDIASAIIDLKSFHKQFPTSWVFFSSYKAIERELKRKKHYTVLESVYEIAIDHLLSNGKREFAFEYTYLLLKKKLERARLLAFVANQETLPENRTSPLFYRDLRLVASQHAWYKLAVIYSKKVLTFLSSQKDLPNFYVDRTMGGAFRTNIFDNEFISYLNNLLYAGMYKSMLSAINHEIESNQYNTDLATLDSFQGKAFLELKNYKKAEKSFFRAYIKGNTSVKEDLKSIYEKRFPRRAEKEFENYFSKKLEKEKGRKKKK